MSDRLLTLDLLFAFLAFTLAMTYWASRATKTAADFYVASHKLRPWQNGIAMSGAFISAVTVLGVPGLIALTGYDGVYYFVGTLLSFVVVQALVAEPFRNAGRFTLADALVPRLRERPVRLAMATSTISVAIIYMVAQIIGAGVLARLLLPIKGTVLGLPPETLAIVVVGLLMTIHVAYGGMLLITWVQIVKVVVLLLGVIVTALVVLGRFGFSFDQLFATATQRSGKGSAYLGPGLRFTNPIDQVSLGIALVLGTAGLPHIMVRLYTVPDARAARKSVSWAIGSGRTSRRWRCWPSRSPPAAPSRCCCCRSTGSASTPTAPSPASSAACRPACS